MAKGIQVPVTQTGLTQSINQAVKQVGAVNLPVNVNPAAFKNLAQPLGRITGLATEFEKSIAASNARVIAFGASVGIINGFQNALSNLVRTGIEVQKTLADISAISGATGTELSKLADGIFDVAKNTGQSFKTASEAALEFSRQGLTLEETIKRTNDALTLSRFTGLSAADSVDTLTAAFNSFQESGITTAQILNKLVAVDSAYAVSAADLAKAISRVGSVGIEAGVSLDELNAAVTAVQQRTARGGAVIGNAFKTIFTNLRSENAIKALRDIGVESLDLQGNLKPSLEVLKELAVRVQSLGEGERVQILETVASKYNINILSALIGDLTDKQSAFTGALQKSASAASEAYDRQKQLNETLAAAINNTTVSVTQLFNKLAEIGVNENLTSLLKFVNDLLSGFNKLLDSESVGANIAKGLIKGISDVFFTIGLPIIAAIFVKLTRDIAQFGIESLKTILGINQQVRERQALEQAVVNTLIKDQQVMATILALSSDRAKQEQYLLNVYNQQIAALQKVQTIAQSVAPALQGAGLSATSGQVRRRAAGGYLPSQEASDVRRGVGGASPSSKVVSIPNFAFGGGKRGTMIANTSEYVVPNFANGGSAIFNPDMVKAYGLPAGAKKITAAGGFIPNFADYGFGKLRERAASASRAITLDAKWASGGVMLLPSPEEAAATNAKSQVIGVQPKDERKLPTGETVGSVKFDAFGLNDAKLKSRSGAKISQIESRIKDVIIGTGTGIVNDFKPLNRASISKDEFVSFYDKKGGASGAAAAVAGSIFEAAVDYALNPQKATNDTQSTLDVPRLSPELINAFGITAPYGITSGADYKISSNRARTFADQIIRNRLYRPFAQQAKASTGYVPNFAKESALSDAIGRELGAGVNPSQIRVTQDGRLRSAENPNGLAVINTRDEPNGKIPNFARQLSTDPRNVRRREARAARNQAAQQTVSDQNKPLTDQTGKLLLAFSGLTLVSSTLQSAFKDTESGVAKFAIAASNVTQTLSSGALLGNLVQQTGLPGLAGRGGFLGGVGRVAGNAGIIGAIGGAGIGIYQEIQAAREAERQRPILAGQEAAAKRFADITAQETNQEDVRAQLLKDFQQGQTEFERIQERLKQGEDRAGVAQIALAQGGVAFDPQLQENLKLLEDRKKLEEELNTLIGSQEKRLQQIGAATNDIENNAKRRSKSESEAAKEAEKRINLEQAFEKIALSILKGDNERLKARAEIAAQDIKNAANFNSFQKQEVEFNRKIQDFQEESTQKQRDLLNLTVQQLIKGGSLASVTEEQANRLKQILETGTEIADNSQLIADLGIKNAAVVNAEIKKVSNKIALQKEETSGLIERFRITQQATNEAQNQLSLFSAQNAVLSAQANSLRNISKIQEQRRRLTEESAQELSIERLRSDIATRGRPSATQSRQLLEQQKQLEFAKQRNSIEEKFRTAQDTAFKNTQSSYKNIVNAATFLSDNEKESLKTRIDSAKTVDEIRKIYAEVGSSITNLGVSDPAVERVYVLYQESAKELEAIGAEIQANLDLSNEEKRIELEKLDIIKKRRDRELEIARIRERSAVQAGIATAVDQLEAETESFSENLANNTTIAFRDGLSEALKLAISQTDDLGEALQGVARNFLQTIQQAFLQQASNQIVVSATKALSLGMAKGGIVKKYADGGRVVGGSGYKDDVPAMLTSGEFVMRKSAVQKYGIENLEKMNNGGIFLPGVRGAGAISGYGDITRFAKQTTTSGATDVMMGGASSAFINLEDQSARLSRFGLLNEDTINQEIRAAQEQGLGLIREREAYRTAQRKAFQQQLIGTLASAAISFGVGKLTAPKVTGVPASLSKTGTPFAANAGPASFGNTASLKGAPISFSGGIGSFRNPIATKPIPFRAYGGLMRRYAAGGPTDDIPALLMGGEYVMSRQSTRKYGKQFFDAINQGRAPRFAEGGMVGGANGTELGDKFDKLSTKLETTAASNISININVTNGGGTETQTQGDTNRGGIDYKKMGDQIRQVVIQTINEEKRLGGSLRSR
jgi:TP901 family phage tail tape measure protein